MKRCLDCKYCVDEKECRRYPPTAISNSNINSAYSSHFPFISGNDWCGEFKTKEQSDEKH